MSVHDDPKTPAVCLAGRAGPEARPFARHKQPAGAVCVRAQPPEGIDPLGAARRGPRTLKIDFVSDVVCPWCAIGLTALEAALANIGDSVQAELHFQPFELNPQMPPEGEDIVEHLARKYGLTAEQIAQNQAAIRARGATLGFTFSKDGRGRTYNTFDAHRLLHWAGLEGGQLALKHALLSAYFTEGENPASHEVLLRAVGTAGLDVDEAQRVLVSGEYANEVREREQFYLAQGINGVPAVIVNDRHLIQGGQPVEVFEQALRQIANAA